MKNGENRLKRHLRSTELQNPERSAATDDDSSNEAGYIKI